MPTRNVVITKRQDQMIEQLVKDGRYQNASEILRDGLRLVEQREANDAGKLAALQAAVDEGIADIEAGRFTTFDTPQALRAHLRGIAKATLGR